MASASFSRTDEYEIRCRITSATRGYYYTIQVKGSDGRWWDKITNLTGSTSYTEYVDVDTTSGYYCRVVQASATGATTYLPSSSGTWVAAYSPPIYTHTINLTLGEGIASAKIAYYDYEGDRYPSSGYVTTYGGEFECADDTNFYIYSVTLESGYYGYKLTGSSSKSDSTTNIVNFTYNGSSDRSYTLTAYGKESTPPSIDYFSNITYHSARVYIDYGDYSSVDVQYKKSSASSWTTKSGITGSYCNLTGLSSNTTYDVRLRYNGSDYTSIDQFTTHVAVTLNYFLGYTSGVYDYVTGEHGEYTSVIDGPSRSPETSYNYYTVSFNGSGGTPSKSSDSTGGYKYNTTYAFSYWKDDYTGTRYDPGDSYMLNSSRTNSLTAQWSSNTVTTNLNITLPNATRSGFVFKGWYNQYGTRVGGYGDSYHPTANETLYAYWNEIFEVTFNTLGGSPQPSVATGIEGDVIRPLPTITTMPPSQTDRTRFTVAFNGNGGTPSTQSDSSGGYDVITEYTRFNGWKSGSTLYQSSYTIPGYDSVLVADYTTRNETSYVPITLPSATYPTPDYTFDGWYNQNGDFVGMAGASYQPLANQTLTAHWKKTSTTYTVTYRSNDGKSDSFTEQSTEMSQTHTQYHLASPKSTWGKGQYWDFAGWHTNSVDPGTELPKPGDQYNLTGNVTLYAIWRHKTIEKFYWTANDSTNIAVGKPISNLTRSKWDALKAKINEVRRAYGKSDFTFTIPTSDKNYQITHEKFNEILDSMEILDIVGTDVDMGETIEAALFHDQSSSTYDSLKGKINHKIDEYNNL